MDEPRAYDDIVAANITAARARRRLSQKTVASRMEALGFGWRQQIVAAAEGGRRRITVSEMLGLALALETSIAALMMPTEDDKRVALPAGQSVGVGSVRYSVIGYPDDSVHWAGDSPEFGDPGRTHTPDIRGSDLITPQPLLPRWKSSSQSEGADGA